MITAEQIRGARAMLKMEQTELAERAGVSMGTVRRIEGLFGPISAQDATLRSIKAALESAGVEFTNDESGTTGPGVRMPADPSVSIMNQIADYVREVVYDELDGARLENPEYFKTQMPHNIASRLKDGIRDSDLTEIVARIVKF